MIAKFCKNIKTKSKLKLLITVQPQNALLIKKLFNDFHNLELKITGWSLKKEGCLRVNITLYNLLNESYFTIFKIYILDTKNLRLPLCEGII